MPVKTDEEIVQEMVDIIVEHLDKVPEPERSCRIRSFARCIEKQAVTNKQSSGAGDE